MQMQKAIIGKKIGMTQIFDEAGRVVPVTLIQAGPCTVMQKKTAEKDGYEAIQLGFKTVPERKLTKPELGHQKKAGVEEFKKVLKEFALKDCSKYEVGDVLTAEVFAEGDFVDVTGTVAALKDVGGIDGAHGTGVTVNRTAAVGVALDSGAMTLNNALEAVALADAGDVNELTLSEDLGGQHVADLVLGAVLQSELLQNLLQLLDAGLLLMADLGLGHVLLFGVLKTQLNGIVAILLGGLLLHDGAGTGLNQGDGHHTASLIEDLGHADLFADDCFLHVRISSYKGYWLGELVSVPIGLGRRHCSANMTRPPL